MAKGKKPWDDKWQKIRQLPGGGHGDIFIVKGQTAEEKEYVLKILRNQDKAERRQRMHREVKALQQLNHPAIPKVIESNTDKFAEDIPLYFVEEYIEGITLENRVNQGRLRLDEALKLTINLSKTLMYCHENGIVHRDIKPDNIILRGANLIDPVIIDFGQSFNKDDLDKVPLTSEGQQLGNRFLHLPELQTGDSPKRNVESDISQVCGILFYAITGKIPGNLDDEKDLKPHQRSAAKTILDEINSPLLIELFDKGFERLFVKRFHSLDAFKGRLREVLDEFEYSSILFGQNTTTVTPETVRQGIRTATLDQSEQELPKNEIEEVKETESNAIQGDHFKGEYGDALMLASLLGAWDDKVEGDREAIRELIEGND